MKSTFTIICNNREVSVERRPDQNKEIFIVHLPSGDLAIELKEDDEGAYRWLDIRTDHETDEAKEAGEAIDMYMVQHKDPL